MLSINFKGGSSASLVVLRLGEVCGVQLDFWARCGGFVISFGGHSGLAARLFVTGRLALFMMGW